MKDGFCEKLLLMRQLHREVLKSDCSLLKVGKILNRLRNKVDEGKLPP